jgi:glycosyltransferase involved in cell wall biosynthesis
MTARQRFRLFGAPRQAAETDSEIDESPGTYLLVVPWDLDTVGGVNQVVINLYHEIERSGRLRPLILVHDWNCISPEERPGASCRTVRLRIRSPANNESSVREILSYLARLPATIHRFRKLIVRHNIKVINSQYPTLGILSFVLMKWSGSFRGKLLLSFQGLDIRNAAKTRGITRLLWRQLLRGADALTACSDSLGTDVRTFDPQSSEYLVTVRNSVSPERLRKERIPAFAISDRLPDGPFVLNVATFEQKKGQDVLLRAFARMANDVPDVDLLLIGADGPTRQQIEFQISEAGLEGRVRCFVDMPHGEVLTFIERATVFVLPSRAEPLGIVTLEAGIFGIPVIASRVDGIPEVINSEEVGMLVEPEDDRALESGLRRLLADGALRASLGTQLRRRVEADFTWQKAWQQYAALLDDYKNATTRAFTRPSLR